MHTIVETLFPRNIYKEKKKWKTKGFADKTSDLNFVIRIIYMQRWKLCDIEMKRKYCIH